MAVIEVLIDIDKELEYARKRLGDLQKKAPMVVRTAINKTAKEAKTKDERITKQTYTAKGDIHSLQFKKATTANLQAILKDKGANISMSHFNHYAGKTKLSAIINKNNGRKTIRKYERPAFLAFTSEGGEFVAVRKPDEYMKDTTGRLSENKSKHTEFIEKMASISSPVMHGNDGTWGTIEPEIHQKLHEYVEKEIERILG